MSNIKYKSYKRIHKYDNPYDIEKTKIKKETSSYVKSKNKSDRLVKKIVTGHSDGSDNLYEKYEELELKSEKDVKNAKEHKKRLKELIDSGEIE